MVEIISIEDVYTALCSSKPTLYKAVAGLIFSSTMSPSTIAELTLNDFLVACCEYFDEDEEKSVENLLKKDPWKIIPYWKLKSKNIITFNTPETTFYLFLYLKEKRMDDLNNLANPLFKRGKNNFLTSSKISSYVTEFNTILNLFNEDYGNKFKSKNLIVTFEEIYDKQMYIEIENKNNLIKLFEGKLANNSKFYRYAVKNPYKIKEYYMRLVPYLTARYYTLNNQGTMYKDYLDEDEISRFVQDFYDIELKEDLNLDYAQEQLLCKFAENLIDVHSFDKNPIFLSKLFKKAFVELKLHNYKFVSNKRYSDFSLDKNIDPKINAKKIEEIICFLEMYDLINIDRNEMCKLLIKYMVHNDYYDRTLWDFDVKRIIKGVMYPLIDEKGSV
ncbi:hypothetical protein [Methanobrevibacter sp. UBA212]|uniref:hypothetical protein n=1 Tax=Methanobrevibacter sp. UBA212 TaxID=1915476 RepID=UPI0025DDAA41|nr:hypothetical protein [Methanobrevibacter sp. UBA212]